MNKKVIGYVLGVILLILLGVEVSYLVLDENKEPAKPAEKEETNQIIKYEQQTHEYFETNNLKYYIDSEKELETFYKLYSNQLNVNKEYLKDNTILIELKPVGNSSTSVKLTDVQVNNNEIDFITEIKTSEVGTEDMALWYLVAIIPNDKVNNNNLKNWEKPSTILEQQESIPKPSETEFKLDANNKYEVITDLRFMTMQNDGGSHTDEYYEIDLNSNNISKIIESYKANLMGTPTTTKKTLYTKTINNTLSLEIKNTLDEIITKEDINADNNYIPFTIKTKDNNKDIYNKETITELRTLLTKIDNF